MPEAPEPTDDEYDLSHYDWRRGWYAGYRAALQAVTTTQQSFDDLPIPRDSSPW